ncbi:type ISP restriction/modification enzyme [Rhodococcus gordoniae]|uniref:type ISP restriction/modification enzyme n=1 Tax=Rhodococcus gordoniae TaxID=223392 RepID=UPI0020CCC3B1|nr:type ISP restriction/modification enzyme [Rhodococcus gordoniae]UTT49883.1 hypothetical protein NMQ04_06735 [Rhodococcus gordoniae]
MSVVEKRLRQLLKSAPTSPDHLFDLLVDGLDWPIPAGFSLSDIELDWEPEELHLDPKKVAKLTQISQIPPLTKTQSFGVFVLTFEGGRLPIGAVRRLVQRLVRNERSRTGAGKIPQFELNDLLFFCLSERSHDMLHVVGFRDTGGKRVLKVLSWGGSVTEAKLDLIVKRAVPDLRWKGDGPSITVDLDSAQGFGGYRAPIRNAEALSSRMAEVAQDLKSEVLALYDVETDEGPLRTLYEEFRTELVADLTAEKFADVYAQTMVYGLFTARVAHPEAFKTGDAASLIQFENPLLNEIYTRFRDQTDGEIDVDELGLADLSAQLAVTDVESVVADFGAKNKREDPVVHFYEVFLAKYDPRARISAGAFYTPLPVVRFIVRAVDHVLKTTFGLPLGVADSGTWGQVCSHLGIPVPVGIRVESRFVSMLDPATGTGTFLVEWIRQAENSFKSVHPNGDWPAHLQRVVFPGMHAFELMLAPYAVAHLRIALAAKEYAVTAPALAILLTDSLDYPTDQPSFAELDDPVAKEGERAAKLKREARFTVVLGNPPYEREKKADADQGRKKGGVVRYGTAGVPPLLAPLSKAMTQAGLGRVAKGMHNVYVYFWRLASWRATERPDGPGIVAFITGSSYLDGIGVGGLRSHMRDRFDELNIIDLGGEGRGANKEENVFDILTPVAIAIGIRSTGAKTCRVNYTRVTGSREKKLGWLDKHDMQSSGFEPVAGEGLDPFSPSADSATDRWPLSYVHPWSARGIQFSRSWPVAETEGTVRARWARLIQATSSERASLLKESRDAQTARDYPSFLRSGRLAPLAGTTGLDPDGIARIGFRSFDIQWCVADRRAIDMPRPPLWHALSDDQVYFTGLPDEGSYTTGPVLVPQIWVPDLNAFNNRGGVVFPLYRDRNGTEVNVEPKLLSAISECFGGEVSAESVALYNYGLLGTGAWLRVVGVTKKVGTVAVPYTTNRDLFNTVVSHGHELLGIATRGRRGTPPASQPKSANLAQDIGRLLPESYSYDEGSHSLSIGNGMIRDVSPKVWAYEVSGLRVIPSWLSYRLAVRAGKKSSPLDDIRPESWKLTDELIDLIHLLEGMVAMEETSELLIRRVLSGEILSMRGNA